jgi:hypothetical protein
MSLNIQILILVAFVNVLIIGLSVAMDSTPLTRKMRREQLYAKLNLHMWLFSLGFVIFSIYNLYEWYVADELYGGRASWVLLNRHPLIFTFLAIIYSSATWLFSIGVIMGLAKFFGIWRIRTPENSN